MAGSKSVHSMRERVRMARKRFEEQVAAINSATVPTGGINKKSPSKVTPSTPKKATSPKKKASSVSPVKAEAEEEVLY